MKKTFFFLILMLSVALSSCTTYYYSVVKSYENSVPQNDDGSFTAEKNNVILTYSFVNYNGDVVYNIYNESDDPVFVDWKKSVLIAEDYALQYSKSNSNTTVYEFSSNSDNLSSVIENATDGKITLAQNDLFIPPHSRTSHSPIALSQVYDMKLPNSEYGNIEIVGIKVKGVVFTPENSPLVFRSYLTVVNVKDKSETVFEDIFYISNAYKTVSQNDILMGFVKRRGDTFYFSETNSTGKTLGWVGVIGLLVAGAVLAPDGGYIDVAGGY